MNIKFLKEKKTMKFLLKLRLVIFFVIVLQTITAFNACMRFQTPKEPQSGEIIADFTSEGCTLMIVTNNCKSSVQKCPFHAEVSTGYGRYGLIEKVEYTVSDQTKSPVTKTDASKYFSFEAEQTGGGKVYATVTLKPRDGAPSKVVRIEGTVPFAVETTPKLPAGLRFEVNYQPWYIEGEPHEPVEYLFKIQLLGGRDALRTIKSVEYRLPDDESKRPRITHRVESDYFVEGSMPAKNESIVILAVIRWKNGETSTHTIPLRPRL